MNIIVTEIIKIIKKSEDAISREESLWGYLVDSFTKCIAEAFEAIDAELADTYKAKGYQVERRDTRTIQCIFGAVSFRRRLMKAPGKKSIYPLDVELGIVPYQRYTPYLQYCVAQIASKCVYRSAALAVNLMTPISMSHQEIGSMIKRAGEQYKAWEKAEEGAEPAENAELKQPEILYIEGDGVAIKGQGQGKREIHRFQIAEGVETCGKRHRLKGTHYFASFSRTEAAGQMKNYLENNYDLSKTIVISNSDGGSGYSQAVFDEIVDGSRRHEHFRDRYHVNKKVKERMNFVKKELVTKLQQSLWRYDREAVQVVLDTAESLAADDREVEQITRLRGYLERNWEYIKPLEQRGLGQYQKGIGTCESNHRLYSYRMKKQGRRWGKNGGEAMVKIITGLRNGDLCKALVEQTRNFNKKQSRLFHGAVRMALKKAKFTEHVGVQCGRIGNYSPSSSAIGHLAKIFS